MVDPCVFLMPLLQGVSYTDISYIRLGACLNPVTVGTVNIVNIWVSNLYIHFMKRTLFTFTIHCEPVFWQDPTIHVHFE